MNERLSRSTSSKKPYTAPTLKKWGTVADLTKTGLTREGTDGKVGSILHSNGR